MLKASLLIAATLGAAAIGWQDSRNWGDDETSADSAYADSRAVCGRLGPPKPPAADRPTAAQIKALKGCDAGKLYYGYGAKPDYAKARLCAMAQAAGSDDEIWGGSTILMQLYANGYGVKRNPDLAAAYACQIDGAPMERHGRVMHMQGLKTDPKDVVDYCDDITSGLAQGYCASRASDELAVARNAKVAALVARLPAPAKALYPGMRKAFDAFVEARGQGEVDLSGTARGAFVVEEEDKLRDQFVLDLDRLVNNRWPAANAAAAKAADAKLNTAYRAALTAAGAKDNYTTTKPEDIRATQRAWLAYRDAFVRFAVARGVSADAALTRITNLRIAQLEEF